MIRTLHHMADAPLALAQVERRAAAGRHLHPRIRQQAQPQSPSCATGSGKQNWSPFTLEPVEFAALNFDFHPAAIRHWLKDRRVSRSNARSPSAISAWGSSNALIPTRLLAWLDSAASLTGNWWQFTPSVFLLTARRWQGRTGQLKAHSSPARPAVQPLADTPPLIELPQLRARAIPVADGIYDFRLNPPERGEVTHARLPAGRPQPAAAPGCHRW